MEIMNMPIMAVNAVREIGSPTTNHCPPSAPRALLPLWKGRGKMEEEQAAFQGLGEGGVVESY